jgi:hypothetical protein
MQTTTRMRIRARVLAQQTARDLRVAQRRLLAISTTPLLDGRLSAVQQNKTHDFKILVFFEALNIFDNPHRHIRSLHGVFHVRFSKL